MPMYNLTEYRDNYSKTTRILWRICSDEPAVDDNGAVNDFTEANADSSLLKIKEKITSHPSNNGAKKIEIMVPLKYLSNFCRILEMNLINCEVSLDLNWSENCVMVATNEEDQATTFSIIDAKLYVSVVTLSTQDNAKLLEQLSINRKNKSVFKFLKWSKFSRSK